MIYTHGFKSMLNTFKLLRINNSSMIHIHGFESMLNTYKLLRINNSSMIYILGFESKLNAHNSHRFKISGVNQLNESNLNMNSSFLDISNEFNEP